MNPSESRPATPHSTIPRHSAFNKLARAKRGLLVCSASIMASSVSMRAADKIWDGDGGALNTWSNGANWNADTVPAFGDSLIFDGTSGLANVNDFTADVSLYNGITFNATAGAFVLGGNAITLTGNLTDNSATVQTINLDLALASSPTMRVADGGNLILGGVV